MKCLNFQNLWQQMHSKLVGIFSYFSVALFSFTQSVMLWSCFILLASITVSWGEVFILHTLVQTKSHIIIFYVLILSRKTFQSSAWKKLLHADHKAFGFFYFSCFALMWYILVQSLVKAISNHISFSFHSNVA